MKKYLKIAVIFMNLFLLGWVVFMSLPIIFRADMIVSVPILGAMSEYEMSGMILMFTLIPAIVINILGYRFSNGESILSRLLLFVSPSFICSIMSISFLALR